MKPKPEEDLSRKHAKLLDKVVLYTVIIAAIAIAAFVIHTYYWFKNHAHPNY